MELTKRIVNAVAIAAPRPGSAAPVDLTGSVVHAAADAALDRINALVGAAPEARDTFLSGNDGRALRNILRRYVMHACVTSQERDA